MCLGFLRLYPRQRAITLNIILEFDPESFGARQTRNEESTGPWKLEQGRQALVKRSCMIYSYDNELNLDVTPHDAYMLCSTFVKS